MYLLIYILFCPTNKLGAARQGLLCLVHCCTQLANVILLSNVILFANRAPIPS